MTRCHRAGWEETHQPAPGRCFRAVALARPIRLAGKKSGWRFCVFAAVARQNPALAPASQEPAHRGGLTAAISAERRTQNPPLKVMIDTG